VACSACPGPDRITTIVKTVVPEKGCHCTQHATPTLLLRAVYHRHLVFSLQADYSLTPNMAIVDPQLVINMPKKLTAWGGIDALTHALESYVSIFATGLWVDGNIWKRPVVDG
jgi:hypothetical protein